jgi:cellulose biosynthesis protein BcsQ
VHNLLIEPRVSIDDVLMKTRVKGMDLVPSNIDLSAADFPGITVTMTIPEACNHSPSATAISKR